MALIIKKSYKVKATKITERLNKQNTTAKILQQIRKLQHEQVTSRRTQTELEITLKDRRI